LLDRNGGDVQLLQTPRIAAETSGIRIDAGRAESVSDAEHLEHVAARQPHHLDAALVLLEDAGLARHCLELRVVQRQTAMKHAAQSCNNVESRSMTTMSCAAQ